MLSLLNSVISERCFVHVERSPWSTLLQADALNGILTTGNRDSTVQAIEAQNMPHRKGTGHAPKTQRSFKCY